MNLFDRGSGCGWVLSAGMLLLGLQGASAAPLPADDFDDGVLNPALWTVDSGQVVESGTVVAVGGGNTGGGQLSSVATTLYERLTFRLNDFYDSRSVNDYTKYSIGYAGYIGSEWILLRTDNTGGSALVVEVNTPNDGNGAGGVPLVSYSIADSTFHDLIIDIQWSASELLVTIDDLNNGAGVDASMSTDDSNLIPSTAMGLVVRGQGADPNYQPFNVDWVNLPEPAAALGALGLGVLALRRRVGQ